MTKWLCSGTKLCCHSVLANFSSGGNLSSLYVAIALLLAFMLFGMVLRIKGLSGEQTSRFFGKGSKSSILTDKVNVSWKEKNMKKT